MIIDMHAHYESRLLDAPSLIKRMDHHGIDQTVLIPYVTNPPVYKKSDVLMGIQRALMRNPLTRILAKKLDDSFHGKDGEWNPWFRQMMGKESVFRIVQHPDNACVADVVSRYPDRLKGWVFVNPIKDNWRAKAEKFLAMPGMVGIKIHPFWHRFSLTEAYDITRYAAEVNVPLVVHLGFDNKEVFRKYVGSFSNQTIIFAHAAKPLYQDAWQILKHQQHHYIDLSSHHVDQSILKEVVNALGADRCLFGTDDPYGDPAAGQLIQDWVCGLNILEEDKKKILGGNFLNILERHAHVI